MINLFQKLQSEQKLKTNGLLLDLGGAEGQKSSPFLKFGYRIILTDINDHLLDQASLNFKKIKDNDWQIINQTIQDFSFEDTYDGIIIANVLPFITDKREISRIIKAVFQSLNKSGFLYFTLFGSNDDWAIQRKDEMSFYSRDEALSILQSTTPYFFSEDIGQGLTKKGQLKNWHIFHFLYIK